MIKAIILDAGGVYLKGSFRNFVNKANKVLGTECFQKCGEKVIAHSEYNKGKISAEEFFREHFEVFISDENMKKLLDLWINNWIIDKEMLELIKRLKENYKLAILSNSDYVNSKNYCEKGWYSYFDVLVLSNEEGILKPDKRIYETTLERLGLSSDECVFIDDQNDALIPAKEMEIKTILYKSTEKLKEELYDLGIDF